MAQKGSTYKPRTQGRMPTEEELDKIAGKAVRKVTKRPAGGDQASTDIMCDASREEVKQIMREHLYWYNRTCVKTDDECADRAAEFFEHVASTGETPTWEKFCLAMGTVREVVFKWERGDLGLTRSNIIKKAKEIIAGYDARMVTEGKIPQVVYIFRSKNYYGMADKSEVVLTPNTGLESASKEDLEQKYLDAAQID